MEVDSEVEIYIYIFLISSCSAFSSAYWHWSREIHVCLSYVYYKVLKRGSIAALLNECIYLFNQEKNYNK